jgi:YgiT-type zinc finger domain-containing protein
MPPETATPAKTHPCPECGGRMTYETRPDTIECGGRSLTLQMLAWWCAECGEAILEGQPLAERETALVELKAKVEGLRALIAADWDEYRAATLVDRDARWWLRRRELPDGKILHLEKMPHFYRLSISPADAPVFDHVYDYEADEAAWTAILEWDGSGDPVGWFRHPQSGRYRPGGDPTKETVDPTK